MGFGVIPDEMFRDSALDGVDMAVYAALDSFCTADRRNCFPSQDTLAAMTKLKPRALRNRVANLVATGWVRIERKHVGGMKRGNGYHLRPAPSCLSENAQLKGKTGTRMPIDRHEDAGVQRHGDAGVTGTRVPIEGSHSEGSHSKDIPPTPRKRVARKPTVASNPPRPDEVGPYIQERTGCSHSLAREQGRQFIDHHSARGWKHKGGHYYDWRAMVRTWIRNDFGGKFARERMM